MTEPPASQSGALSRLGQLGISSLSRMSAIYLWIIFLVLFGILQSKLFLTTSTVQLVFSQGAVTAVLALAFLVPLTTDAFDLSVGEVMSLTIVLMNYIPSKWGLPVPVAIVLVIAISASIGVVTGFIVVKLRVNSLIATLGMSQILTAVQLYISQNRQIAYPFDSSFVKAGNGTIFGIPYLDIYLLVIAAVIWFVLEQTGLGRRMFAVGGNREAARLVGLRSDRIVWGSLVTSAVVAAIAGVMYTAQVGAYTADVGQGYLFPALAAVFFGASQLSQRPNVWGTLIAFFALAFGIQGLTLQFGAGTFWVSPLFQGVALVLAVSAASLRGSTPNRDARNLARAVRRRASDPPPGDQADPPPTPGGDGPQAGTAEQLAGQSEVR